LGIEDTNNALAILSTRGITGAEAGTALKSMLTNLQRPTTAVRAFAASSATQID
jgi:TP901 family phage tail tape measure protein